jgi:hypothetical protein
MSELARRQRAEERRRAVMRFVPLEEVEPDLDPIRGEQAISLVTQLTRESWSLSGRPVPTYTRSETPYRFVPGPPSGSRSVVPGKGLADTGAMLALQDPSLEAQS